MIPWNRYALTIKVDRLTGGIPANPKMMQAWLETNDAPPEGSAEQLAMQAKLDPELTHGVVFFRDEDDVPCYESRCFKAALKEAANILKGVKDGNAIIDVKSFRSKLAERVFVGPRLVRIGAEIQRAERPITPMTMQGPRTSIKRQEFADDVTMSFEIKVLDDGVITEAYLRLILEYLQEGGIGADRSQGSGTFSIVEFVKVP